MKIYLLNDPKQYNNYARFSHIGTWTDGQLCKECNQPTSMLVDPLIIEWEPDSDCIGDFSWCGYTLLITENVASNLKKDNYAVDFGKVKVVKSSTILKGRKIVSYPYKGPDLYWLKPRVSISLNITESNVELIYSCNTCNNIKYKFRTTNLIIDRSNWEGAKIFMISQFQRSGATFITEDALTRLLGTGFTNFGFSGAGVII